MSLSAGGSDELVQPVRIPDERVVGVLAVGEAVSTAQLPSALNHLACEGI